MLTAAIGESGRALRGGGPGPQQLAARWGAGSLNEAEKLVVLLGGGVYHDRALLPAYLDAVQSPELRLRMAAAVGFFDLVGATPPLPSQMPDTPESWGRLHRMMRDLRWVLRRQSLVGVWADSYVAGRSSLRPELFAFRLPGIECLKAIRRLAAPADLQEILSLWPFLESTVDRAVVMGTIEAITLQSFVSHSLDPRQPSGEWQLHAGLAAIAQWVASLCGPVDGERQLWLSLERNKLLDANGGANAASWFGALRFRFPPFTPLAAERLMDATGMALPLDCLDFDNPLNHNTCQRLRDQLPISSWVDPAKPKRR